MLNSTLNIAGAFLNRGDGPIISGSEVGDTLMPRGYFEFGPEGNVITDSFVYEYAVEPGTTLLINVHDGSLPNEINGPLALKNIKMVMISTAQGGKPIKFGPQGHAGAAQLWFENDAGTEVGTGHTPTGCDSIRGVSLQVEDSGEGWSIDAGNSKLAFYNPDDEDIVVFRIWLQGEAVS